MRKWGKIYEEALRAVYAEDLPHAIELFEKCIERGADRWEPYYGHAWALLRSSNGGDDVSARAEADLRKALELGGPDCPDIAALLGRMRLYHGDSAEALPFFLKAAGRSSHAEEVEDGLVEALSQILIELQRGDPEKGIDECDRLETLVNAGAIPDLISQALLAEVFSTRALCHSQRSETDKAEADWRRVMQIVPSHPLVPEALKKPGVAAGQSRSGGTPDPTFDDIGGHDVGETYQSELCGLFDTYFSGADVETMRVRMAMYGQAPTRSFLLFGPSGCGKTYIIRAFAGEYRRRFGRELPLHRIRLDQVMVKWVGDTEKAITKLFEEAIRTQPSILFADEVDAIGMSREGGQDWRVSQTAHLLQEVDRLQTESSFVMFFGCTNRIWSVDMALLRRFDRLIPVELPNVEVRKMIFKVHLDRLGPSVRPAEFDLDRLAEASHGLTPGDISKAVRKSIDQHLAGRNRNGAPAALEQWRIEEAVNQARNPIHLQRWLSDSLRSLRSLGHGDMADEVERMYRPYVAADSPGNGSALGVRPIPQEAWTEYQGYQESVVLRMKRR